MLIMLTSSDHTYVARSHDSESHEQRHMHPTHPVMTTALDYNYYISDPMILKPYTNNNNLNVIRITEMKSVPIGPQKLLLSKKLH